MENDYQVTLDLIKKIHELTESKKLNWKKYDHYNKWSENTYYSRYNNSVLFFDKPNKFFYTMESGDNSRIYRIGERKVIFNTCDPKLKIYLEKLYTLVESNTKEYLIEIENQLQKEREERIKAEELERLNNQKEILNQLNNFDYSDVPISTEGFSFDAKKPKRPESDILCEGFHRKPLPKEGEIRKVKELNICSKFPFICTVENTYRFLNDNWIKVDQND